MASRLTFMRDRDGYLYRQGERVLAFHYKMLYDAKVLNRDFRQTERGSEPFYQIHYQGWKDRYDEWVEEGRLLKRTEENKQMQREMKEIKEQQKREVADRKRKKKLMKASRNNKSKSSESPGELASTKKRRRTSGIGEATCSNSNGVSLVAAGSGKGCNSLVQPVALEIPSRVKQRLIIGQENVKIHGMLLHIPATVSVTVLMKQYISARKAGSLDVSVVQQLHQLFNVCLGRRLLFRFERKQYADNMRRNPGKSLADLYGTEHFLRLLVNLPEFMSSASLEEYKNREVLRVANDLLCYIDENFNRLVEVDKYDAAPQTYVKAIIT